MLFQAEDHMIKSPFRLHRLWILLTIPVSFLLLFLASEQKNFAEAYAVSVYPKLSHFGNAITGAVPFSIGEVFVFLLIVFLVAAVIRFVFRMIRSKGSRGITAWKFLVNLFCLAGVLFLFFTLNCGINYHRSTFAETCGLEIKESTKPELVTLCKSLAADSSSLRKEVETGSNSVMELRSRKFSQNTDKARLAFDSLSKGYPLLRPGYSGPKPVFSSELMSRCNITGMFFPFTFEANVNTDIPDYTLPFTMCHELSHLRGYMREDEANFIAYLACEKSSDADFRYSGTAMAFTYANNALFSADSKTADEIYASLSSGVQRDFQFNNEYWDRFKGPVAEASTKANNNYLKANSQTDGVQSYGRMVDLLLALQRSKKK
jgi:hypothetical protein